MGTQFVWVDHDRWVREVALKEACTCPNCRTVWAHKDSAEWIVEHFGSRSQPVTCSECGMASVIAGKRLGPRKIYQAPDPVHPRTEQPPKRGWFQRSRVREEATDYEYQR